MWVFKKNPQISNNLEFFSSQQNFINRFLQFANSSDNFLSKIGHEDFDIVLFKEQCLETEHILMEFLKDMEVKFSKCFDEKNLHLIDLALDFVKSLIDFQCNMNEEQLSRKFIN